MPGLSGTLCIWRDLTVARSWAAQVRLSRRFRQLAEHKNVRSVVAAAIARELAGFLWAEMVAEV